MRLRGLEPLYPGTEIAATVRPEHKVAVVAHQAMAGQPDRHTGTGIAEPHDEPMMVVGVVAHPRLPIAAVQGMAATTTDRGACDSRHAMILAVNAMPGKPIPVAVISRAGRQPASAGLVPAVRRVVG
jgi:hypothetical protein